MARAVEGADAVVNLVGVMGGNMQRIHVDGARAVAEAVRHAGVGALVHVSAIGADENGAAAYARSKGQGEAAVRQAFPDATILRPSIVFGREDQFVNRFAGMVSAPIVPILRAGVKFQPVFAGDVGEAVATALRDPEAHGGRTYELGGPDVIAMGELVRWIAKTLGRKPNFVEMPDFAGALLARLPGSPISRDQWLILHQDNDVTGTHVSA